LFSREDDEDLLTLKEQNEVPAQLVENLIALKRYATFLILTKGTVSRDDVEVRR
jgi:hypothetical protein